MASTDLRLLVHIKSYKNLGRVRLLQSGFWHISTPSVAIKVSYGDRVVTKYCIVSEMNLCTLYDLFVKVIFSYEESGV